MYHISGNKHVRKVIERFKCFENTHWILIKVIYSRFKRFKCITYPQESLLVDSQIASHAPALKQKASPKLEEQLEENLRPSQIQLDYQTDSNTTVRYAVSNESEQKGLSAVLKRILTLVFLKQPIPDGPAHLPFSLVLYKHEIMDPILLVEGQTDAGALENSQGLLK